MTSLPQIDEAEELHIPVPWGHVAAKWWGPKNVRPILSLHGWQDNAGSFDRLMPLLPAHMSFLAIDLPGHGLSSPYPPGLMYDQILMVSVIRILQREYKWKKVSIMGHSMGAILGFMFTSLFPEDVDMMIAIDGLKLFYTEPDKFVPLGKSIIKGLIQEIERNETKKTEPPSYFYDELVQKTYDGMLGAIDKEHAHHLLKRGVRKSELYPDKYYFVRDNRIKHLHFVTFQKEFCDELAKRIKAPYLFIAASQSAHINREKSSTSFEFLKTMGNTLPDFQLKGVDGKHHVHLNEPTKVSGIISEFILKHRPAGAEDKMSNSDGIKAKL